MSQKNGLRQLDELPGGSKVAKKVGRVHPSKRTVKFVLRAVEAQAADDDHAVELVQAVSNDKTLLTTDVSTKLSSLLDAGCLLDIVHVDHSRPSIWRACTRP